MKIAIPTEDKSGLAADVAEHFGRCEAYTFLDEKGDVIEIIGNTSEHGGGTMLPPELLKKHGTDVLLCRELGPRALMLCKQLGIDVYVNQAETVKEIFDLWKNKRIKKADFSDICEEHKT